MESGHQSMSTVYLSTTLMALRRFERALSDALPESSVTSSTRTTSRDRRTVENSLDGSSLRTTATWGSPSSGE